MSGTETELKRLLNKAIDDAWIAGIEKGKIDGRRNGLEEALDIARAHQGESLQTLRMKLEEALEVK